MSKYTYARVKPEKSEEWKYFKFARGNMDTESIIKFLDAKCGKVREVEVINRIEFEKAVGRYGGVFV